ncbi:MAG TPA: ABC transporter, partial [Burkholderiales bacterium]|nr:ABC transporter [Burkholderiales bacterium]
MKPEPVDRLAPAAPQPATAFARLRHLAILLDFVVPYRARIAGAAIALIVAAGSFLIIGQGLRRVVDMGFAHGDASALNAALVALLGVIAVMAAATYTRFYLVSWLGERVIADMRR